MVDGITTNSILRSASTRDRGEVLQHMRCSHYYTTTRHALRMYIEMHVLHVLLRVHLHTHYCIYYYYESIASLLTAEMDSTPTPEMRR